MSKLADNDHEQNQQHMTDGDLLRLRASRDSAVQAASEAVRDTTRNIQVVQ